MATTAANLFATFREDFLQEEIVLEFNDNTDAWNEFNEADVAWNGVHGVIVLNNERNDSVGASSGNNTPVAGQEGYDRLIVTAKKVYGSTGIDGATLAQAKKKPNALAVQVATSMERLVKDFKKKLTSYVFTGGPFIGYVWIRTNALAAYPYAGRFADIAVNGEIAGVCQVRFIRMDTYAQIGADTQLNALTSTTLTLNANIDTTVVPVGTLIAVQVVGAQAALTEKVVIPGKTVAAVTQEPQGIIGNMSNPSLFGIDRSLSTAGAIAMRGNFRTGNNGSVINPLAFEDLDTDFANIMTRIGERPHMRWLSWVQLTSYKTLLQGVFTAGSSANNVRLDPSSQSGKQNVGPKVTATDSGYEHGMIPFRCSDVCPNGIIFTVNKDTYKRAILEEGHWVGTELGLDAMQRIQGTDSFSATWGMYYDLVCHTPAANGVISAIS